MSDAAAAPPLDLAIVGAGLTGLRCARLALAAGRSLGLFERAPSPGGSARTQRSEGFACELGAFALAGADWADHCRTLTRPPQGQPLEAAAHTGFTWDGVTLRAAPVDGDPHSGATGLEELAVAYRRELGPTLQLGRAVTSLQPHGDGWVLSLDGAPIAARAVTLATPLDVAANLLGALDPALATAAARLRRSPGALAFVGTWQDAAASASLRGYGVLCVEPDQGTPIAARELLFCTNAFRRRAQAGKALVRIELGGAHLGDCDDDAVAACSEAELRRITGWSGTVLFRRVHRFSTLVRDGAYTECQVRVRDLVARAPGLGWAGHASGTPQC